MRSVMNLYKRNACWVVEKPEVKGPLGRSRHKLEDNINRDNEKIEQEGVAWFYLVQDMFKLQAVVDTVMNFSS